MKPKGGSRKRLRNGLTPKENAFKNKILEQIATTGDINGTQAVMEVYDTTNAKSAGVIASDNLNKPNIREQIEKALEDQGISTATILQNINYLANSRPEKINANAMLKANIEILKVIGAYPDKKSMHLNVNLKGKVGTMGFEEARQVFGTLNDEATEIVDDADPTPQPVV